jgi:hypothetical protein
MVSVIKRVSFCATLFLLDAASVAGQETRGRIPGTIVDGQGGVVAGAAVTVISRTGHHSD